MAESAIYIPTKNRSATFVTKTISSIDRALTENAWRGVGIDVYLVSEIQYRSEIEQLVGNWGNFEVEPVWLKALERGIGYARSIIIKHADKQGYESIAMIDDDQLMTGDVAGWLNAARRDDIVSLGAYKRIYGLYLRGTAMTANHGQPGVWLHKGSVGNGAFALNVANVVEIGSYDPRLRHLEDHELCRNNYAKRGAPWFIYTGVYAGEGTSNKVMRQFGGTSTEDRHPDVKAQSQAICHENWPEYVTAPPKRYRCDWRKMIGDYTSIATWPLEDIKTEEPWDWQDA